jgi:hypothetical protein
MKLTIKTVNEWYNSLPHVKEKKQKQKQNKNRNKRR